MGMGGKVRIRITGACPEDCLYRMTMEGIRFRDYCKTDMLTAELTVPLRDLNTATSCAKKTMCEMKILGISGLFPGLKAMGTRIGYLFVLVFLLILVFWIQGHIFFLEVEGNTTISDEEILQILEESGVGFFTKTSEIDLNVLKNEILGQIPRLGWITINTEGPIATVMVREREEKPVAVENQAPGNVLAAKGGIIEDVTVTGGTAQVRLGDVVTEGQLLISGVTNLDKTLLLSHAEGEVTARTFTRKKAILEESIQEKSYTGEEITRFSITFGKKTINLYKTSGISYDNYDKMTVRKTLTLPGDYALPVTVTVTVFREYEQAEKLLAEQDAEEFLEEAVRRDMEAKLSAGMILDLHLQCKMQEGLYVGSGIAECREDIGVSVEIKE